MEDKPIDPFKAALARPSKGFMIAVNASDVQSQKPELTAEQANAFLRRHAQMIAITMIEAGHAAIRQLLEEHHDN